MRNFFPEQIVKFGCRILLHLGHHVAVRIHRDTNAGMTSTLTRHLRMNVEAHEDRKVGMAKIVESDANAGFTHISPESELTEEPSSHAPLFWQTTASLFS